MTSVSRSKEPGRVARFGVRIGLGAASVLGPAGAFLIHPPLATAILAVELLIPSVIVMTALYGSERISARGMRLLCLMLGTSPKQYLPPQDDQK